MRSGSAEASAEQNLASLLTASAARVPAAIALRQGDTAVSYRTLERVSAEVAGLLAGRGVGPGDRVAMMLPNVVHFAAVYYGILRAGAIVVPLNVLLKRREVDYHLEDSGARELFAWADFAGECPDSALRVEPGAFEAMLAGAEPAAAPVPRRPDDTAVILYTSGTTGLPKGAELTHANLRVNAGVTREQFGLGPGTVTLGALPLFHSFGQTCVLNATISSGGTVTLLPRFDAEEALRTMERDRVTAFMGVPTMYSALLAAPSVATTDLSSLRLCASGGAAMPVELLRRAQTVLGCPVLEGYGLSETSPTAAFNHPDREQKPGSVGTPIDGVEMKVVDDDGHALPTGTPGEIVIRGHNVMKGYWRREEATRDAIRDGWFHTGDIATVDEDGYFFIVDRKKDLIIRGGYNVYPRELEEVLYGHPAVREAAVVGVPHAELGEEVAAVVALREGEAVDAEALRTWLRERVAAYKYPRHVWFVDDLPKGPTGKILKRAIVLPPALVNLTARPSDDGGSSTGSVAPAG
jgi:long-chain acyl-CoA synthetase